MKNEEKIFAGGHDDEWIRNNVWDAPKTFSQQQSALSSKHLRPSLWALLSLMFLIEFNFFFWKKNYLFIYFYYISGNNKQQQQHTPPFFILYNSCPRFCRWLLDSLFSHPHPPLSQDYENHHIIIHTYVCVYVCVYSSSSVWLENIINSFSFKGGQFRKIERELSWLSQPACRADPRWRRLRRRGRDRWTGLIRGLGWGSGESGWLR